MNDRDAFDPYHPSGIVCIRHFAGIFCDSVRLCRARGHRHDLLASSFILHIHVRVNHCVQLILDETAADNVKFLEGICRHFASTQIDALHPEVLHELKVAVGIREVLFKGGQAIHLAEFQTGHCVGKLAEMSGLHADAAACCRRIAFGHGTEASEHAQVAVRLLMWTFEDDICHDGQVHLCKRVGVFAATEVESF
eukprot:3931917-Rhodomonas_salina.1